MAKFCASCGSQLSDDTKFCAVCGTPVSGAAAPQMAQPTPTMQSAPVTGVEPKSKIVAGLLGLFLGAWGIHNFYLGNTGRGVAQILVTIFTCGIGSLWGVIEGILILCGSIKTDANGNPLGD